MFRSYPFAIKEKKKKDKSQNKTKKGKILARNSFMAWLLWYE